VACGLNFDTLVMVLGTNNRDECAAFKTVKTELQAATTAVGLALTWWLPSPRVRQRLVAALPRKVGVGAGLGGSINACGPLQSRPGDDETTALLE
jgi:hypothetical protein